MALPTEPQEPRVFDTEPDVPAEGNPAINGQPETYRIFDIPAPEAPATVSPQAEYDPYYHSVLIGAPVEAIRPALEAGAHVTFDAQARQMTQNNRQALVEDFVANPEAHPGLAELQAEIMAIENINKHVTPATVALLTSPNPVFQDYAVQKVGRLFAAQSLIQQRMEMAGEGFLAATGDIVDFMVSSPINALMIEKEEEFAERAADLMYDFRGTDEEFAVEFNQILDEMADQGFFTDENRFFASEFVSLFAAGTGSSEARWQRAWAIFDTLSLGLAVAPRALKTTTAVGRAIRSGNIAEQVRTGAGTAASIVRSPARLIGSRTNDPVAVGRVHTESRIMDDPQAPDLLHNETAPSIYTPDNMRPERWAHTSHVAAAAYERGSRVLAEVKDLAARTGSSMDEDRIKLLEARLQSDAKAQAEASGDLSYIDAHLSVDELDNVYFSEIRGTNEGMSFTGENGRIAAQNLADNIGGEVLEWQQPGHFVVVQSRNVPTTLRDLSKDALLTFTATNPEELATGPIARWLGSPGTQTTAANRAALLTAEGVQELWMKTLSDRIREATKLNSRAQRREVDQMFEMLRDGAFSGRRTAFTEAEFRTEFANKFKRPPEDSQVALYLRVQDAYDAESFLIADEWFKGHVSDGVVVLNNEYRVVPTRARDIPEDAKVWDTAQDRFVNARDLPGEHTIYRNYDPDQNILGSEAMYVMGDALRTRRLYHSDILARNPGGARMYRNGEINFYIKQDRTRVMADGSTHQVSPLTVMGVKTMDEANDVVRSLNTIIDEFAKVLGRKEFTNADITNLRGNRQLDAAIARNSKWNPSIHNLDQLLKWADESGVNLSKKFQPVRHGEKLSKDLAGGFGGMTFGRAMDARALNPRARRNEALLGYGGKELRKYSPMKAMEFRRGEVIANQSHQAYMARAVNGLLKTAIRNNVLDNIDDLKGMTLAQKLREAKIRDMPGVGAKLELERQKILARLDRRGLWDDKWELAMNNLSIFLYGKGAKKLSNLPADIASTNPLTAMRGIVFNAKLGMFNPSQLYVQASQVINIFGVAGVNGLRGGALYPAVRWALANGNPAVIRRIAEAVAPPTGLTPDEFVDMVQMFKDHGRSMVGVSLAEFGTDASVASSVLGETVNRVMDKSRFFFNEGELVARTTAWNTAYIEYLKKFPGRSPRSQQGVRWIMNRQDTLTQSMTGASRIGLDKYPFTQFMSYQFRINEAIFAGSFGGKAVLTKAERARLAMTHTVVFGATGWAATGFAMDYYKHRYGTELDEGVYRAIRKGALDYFLSEISQVDTSLSSRLGSGDNMFMLMKDMAENNIFELAGGPSGEVTYEFLRVLIGGSRNLAKGVTTGDFEDLGSSLGRFARTFSTGNQAYNAWMAFHVGQYLTKDNALIDNGLGDLEAMYIALGVPLEDHEEAFKFSTYSQFEKVLLGSTVSAVQREWNTVNALLDRGENQEAGEVMKGIALLLHSLPSYDRYLVDQQVRQTSGTITDNTMIRALQRDIAQDFEQEEN